MSKTCGCPTDGCLPKRHTAGGDPRDGLYPFRPGKTARVRRRRASRFTSQEQSR